MLFPLGSYKVQYIITGAESNVITWPQAARNMWTKCAGIDIITRTQHTDRWGHVLWDSSDGQKVIHWGLDIMPGILRTASWSEFLSMKIIAFLFKFNWNLFPSVQWMVSQHWFRWWLGTWQLPSHYLNQCWPGLWMHICITLPWWFNTQVD